MTGRPHLTEHRLLELACTAGDHDAREARDLQHIAACDACSQRLAVLAQHLAASRAAAQAEADATFDDARLARQRARVLDRVARLGSPPRILGFPGAVVQSPSAERRLRRHRWLTVAAAAGLLAGLVAGQALRRPAASAPVWHTATTAPARTAPRVRAVESRGDDDAFLDAVDSALSIQRVSELSALDALTPAAHEVR